eukprot:scaffold232183_cov55-Attheya_sp.AAC.1
MSVVPGNKNSSTNRAEKRQKAREKVQSFRKNNSLEARRGEVKALEERVKDETPASGALTVGDSKAKVAFRALPISLATLRGLEESQFVELTEIQNLCLPHALAGRDILGAARTGSGKTLAFLVPLLETLYRSFHSDGPGAIVLSPTRELALQIFAVLRKIGSHHAFSAGLLVGGKSEFRIEQAHVGSTHILIATPGRLLQHLEQTPDLDTSQLKILVLDEADRILDMGFRDQLVRILDYLPAGRGNRTISTSQEPNSQYHDGTRQTLLFSATQTKRVADLAALSLNKPEYIGVYDKAKMTTPPNLQQSLVVVPLEHKLNAIYSFIRSHLKSRIIVFMASCSQVRHAWDVFCSLQPGLSVLALHGKMAQERRTQIYFDFIQKRPQGTVLFATDVAARGLDFPDVDWVVQADAPEDVDMYIHRVGRTARYTRGGKALLMLLPTELDSFTHLLKDQAKLPIRQVHINPTKTVTVTQRAAGLVASKPALNALAKKAFKSYVRSYHLQPNKGLFDFPKILPSLDDFSTSLGLASTPSVRFLKKVKGRDDLRAKKNVNHKLHRLKEQIKAERLQKKIEQLGNAGDLLLKKKKRSKEESEEDDDDDGLLVVKQKHKWGKETEDDENLPEVDLHQVSKARNAKRIRIDASHNPNNKRVVFTDDGEEQDVSTMSMSNTTTTTSQDDETTGKQTSTLEQANEDYVNQIRERLDKNQELDRAEEKERVREKHKKRRIQEKGDLSEEESEDEEGGVTLGNEDDNKNLSEDQDDDNEPSDYSSDDSDDDDDDSDVEDKESMALAMLRQS